MLKAFKRGLDSALRIVEIPAHGAHAHVPAALGDHLKPLQLAHAAIGIEHYYLCMRRVRKARKRGLAGIPAGGGEYNKVLFKAVFLPRGVHKVRQYAKRHVLECAGWPMPKLQYMRIPRLNNGAEGGSIEFSAVARVHRGKYALIGDIVYQRAYNAGKKLPPFKRIKPRRKERRQFLGYVQTPVRRKPGEQRKRRRGTFRGIPCAEILH